ncbi:MAG: Gfo/Idh/MocA family oxidoreductase [Bacteroidota bacterium]|nr:Gfo/Idh/MocA family oxidoreductase [Bacteroidota bacterium]
MNIAILGPGGIADDQHAPAVLQHPKTTLWSVLSRSSERGAAFAHRHYLQAPNPIHTDLASLLEDDDLDGVIIATPDRLHAPQAIAAARAGKHVLLEKPMATDLEECDAILRACQDHGVTLAMAYHHRWHLGHRALQQQVREGVLGKLRHMRVHWTFRASDGSNWRAAPETGRWWALAANGTHCIDLIRWFMRPTEGEITDIRTMISRARFEGPHDETSLVLMQFESGATSEICVSVQFASDPRVEIYGDTGWIRMEGTLGRHGAGHITTNGAPVSFEVQNPFLGELNDWVEAVHNVRPPEVDGHEGRANVQILLQALEAAWI